MLTDPGVVQASLCMLYWAESNVTKATLCLAIEWSDLGNQELHTFFIQGIGIWSK
jgi:hypothetical protein